MSAPKWLDVVTLRWLADTLEKDADRCEALSLQAVEAGLLAEEHVQRQVTRALRQYQYMLHNVAVRLEDEEAVERAQERKAKGREDG